MGVCGYGGTVETGHALSPEIRNSKLRINWG
jgi:hypothetical protein